jgi:hypothetical protein
MFRVFLNGVQIPGLSSTADGVTQEFEVDAPDGRKVDEYARAYVASMELPAGVTTGKIQRRWVTWATVKAPRAVEPPTVLANGEQAGDAPSQPGDSETFAGLTTGEAPEPVAVDAEPHKRRR